MKNLYLLSSNLFNWAEARNIPLILARPKLTEQDFFETDLDLIIEEKNVQPAIAYLQEEGLQIICSYQRSDGVTYYFYDKENKDRSFFHIDFITSLSYRGITYLYLSEVINRIFKNEGLNYLDEIDQLTVLIATHGLKHKNFNKIFRYKRFLQETLKAFPDAVQQSLEVLFGSNVSADIMNAIRSEQSYSIRPIYYLIGAWKRSGPVCTLQTALYFSTEIKRRFRMRKYKLAFLGVDGAGKTSLINQLKAELDEAYPSIKHVHFMPAFPWGKEKTSYNVQKNPHGKKQRGYVLSLLKLIYFYLRYWLVELYPCSVPILYLYDRYIYDLAIDPIRFRSKGLSGSSLWRAIRLFPKPDISFVLDVPAEIAYQRKQEVSLKEVIRQAEEYKNLSNQTSEVYFLRSDFSLDKVAAVAKNYIIDKLSVLNDSVKY